MPRRRRALIIVNPAAGRRRSGANRLARIVAALERRGCAVVLRATGLASGEAERLAREAEPDFDIVVAAGGDGTLHAVVNGLAAAAAASPPPFSRPLALLPFGTVNLVAREIGLPRRSEALAELIVSAPARPIWPGRVGDRLFMMMASSGFDAAIVAAVDPRLKRALGRFAFIYAMTRALLHYPARGRGLTVCVAGIDYCATTLIAARGRFYAGPYVIAPRADLAEPILDLVLFRRAGRLAVLRYFSALLLGRISRRKDVIFLRAADALVTAGDALPVQADGELVGHLPVALGVAKRPLYLVRPS